MSLVTDTSLTSLLEVNETALRDHAMESDALSRRKPTDRKRTWGIFYTPVELSRCLAEWAITSRSDTVLEPSFGGCGFLNETALALKQKGAREPWQQLCGCDKDLRAFIYLPALYRRKAPSRRFLHRNFLDTVPTDYCIKQFHVVIGNPPYVRRHNMRSYQISSAEAVDAYGPFTVSRRASLWAYFIIHSLRFLREGGRMAWVLPRSLSQSDYGREVVKLLCGQFDAVTVISLQKRLFVAEGADELVDVLLCRGHRANHSLAVHPLIAYADSLEELERKMGREATASCVMPVNISSGREDLLTTAERQALDQYGRIVGIQSFGEIARVRIGIVTGLTRFFVLSRTALHAVGLTKDLCTPLLTRASYARGLSWQQADVAHSIETDHRILLVRSDLKATNRYWAGFPSELRESIRTFRKRPVWNAPDDGMIPGAFFFGLVDNGPRLVLNDAGINSNNSVHRIYFKKDIDPVMKRALALLFLSSYVQVSGELVGRVCGAGGLKFEPSDVAKLKIITPPGGLAAAMLTELWPKVDLLLRNGREQEAIQCVDASVQASTAGLLRNEAIRLVQSALKKLRNARKCKSEE